MLTNLMVFNSILSNQTSGCPYIVPWDYNTGCYITQNTYTGEIEEYIVGVFNGNNSISQTTIDTLNKLRYTYFNNFANTNINYNDILLLFKSNIYVVLKYAEEVFLDILNMYASILTGKFYCMKEYMSISNISILLELYNNFYNNQIYSDNNGLPQQSIVNLIPEKQNLDSIILKFSLYYNNVQNLGLVFNTVKLNDEEAIVFCSNIRKYFYKNMERSEYSYFYLNVNNSGATELYSYWGITGNVPIYTNLSNGKLPNNNHLYNNQFPNDFFDGIYGVPGGEIQSYYYNVNAVTSELQNTYTEGGVYDIIYGYNKSINYTGPVGGSNYYCNGKTYYVYNDIAMTSLNSKVYLTFETNGATGSGNNVPIGIGLPLVYYPLSSNLILYPPAP
jgi:hypothetical protein